MGTADAHPSDQRNLVGISPGAVTDWILRAVPDAVGPLTFTFVAGGRSNLTYRVNDAAGHVWALRRPPTGNILATAHDMGREYLFLTALRPTVVPVAEPVAYCEDPDVTGAPFYVMGFVDGTVLTDEAAALTLSLPARAAAADSIVDTLVDLHSVDPIEVGLGILARPGSFVERQLRRWHRQIHATAEAEAAAMRDAGMADGAAGKDLELLDAVHALLVERAPAAAPVAIAHGDYRAGNLAVDSTGRVRGIFDWELATLGDPLADLGYLLSTWVRPGDGTTSMTVTPSAAPGFPEAAYLGERYAAQSGRDVSALPYYVAFARWRGACIWHGVAARYRAGVMGEQKLDEGSDTVVENQVRAALELLEASA